MKGFQSFQLTRSFMGLLERSQFGPLWVLWQVPEAMKCLSADWTDDHRLGSTSTI